MAQKRILTTSWGKPIADNQNSVTAGPRGPVLMQDTTLLDKLAHFDRERIPERVVHAKGAGAHGHFEVTQDVTRYCKAKFLERVGKKTPVFLRFSTVGGEKGSADTERDPRGFALKFYTEEGNWDMTGNNTPIFFIRDPMKFPDFIHTQKRNPQTGLKDPDAFWDFLSLVPESVHQVTYLFGPRGTPDGYRQMNGYSSHTLKWVNANNEEFFVKVHFKTETGTKELTGKRAGQLAGEDPDYATRDLFNHIAAGKEAVWKMYVQVMPADQAESYRFDILDITKIWPHADYPLIEVGRLVLNRNPINYFAEVEQAAFSPAHMVPGIEPTNDKMLQGRLFSYNDTHRHRLGPNFDQIPINTPYMARVANYRRDGFMTVNGNFGNEPNYEPNSFAGAPKADANFAMKPFAVSGEANQYGYTHPNSDFEQPGMLYRAAMSAEARAELLGNITGHLRNARKDLQEKQVKIFYKCDPEYGTKVAEGLGLPAHAARM